MKQFMKEAISSGIILFNENESIRKYLLLNYPTGHWDFIKGGIENGENPHQTSIRETREETGITSLMGLKKKLNIFSEQIIIIYTKK